MNPTVSNISALAGIALVGAGTAMLNVPAALIVVGVLVLGMTIAGIIMSRKG